MDINPARSHLLIDLTCPHCQKKNSVTVASNSAAYHHDESELRCAYCGKPWRVRLPGPIYAGPFPK
jgi:transcription elongation factor Elf1